MTRILILMLGAILTLAGCGGGSDGLEYGAPEVTVKNLDGRTVMVAVGGDRHTFQSNSTHEFERVQNNKRYNVSISGNKSCGFTGSHDANNDQPTQSTSSKNANEHFTIRCGLSSDGTPGGGSGDDEDEDAEPGVPYIALSINGETGTADAPIKDGRPAKVEARLTLDGQPLKNKMLQARVSPSDVAKLSKETIATNDQGVAEITLANGAKGGAAELIVTYVDSDEERAGNSIVISSEGGNTVEEAAEGSMEVEIDYADGKTQVEDGSPATVTVTVIDDEGNKVDGAAVAFELDTQFGEIGRLEKETAQTVNGEASIKVFAGEKLGTGVIKAHVFHAEDRDLVGLSRSVAFSTRGNEKLDDEDTSTQDLQVNILNETISIEEGGSVSVEVEVASIEDDELIEGALVRFEIEDSDIGRLEPSSAVTNEEGVAKVVLHAGTKKGASYLVAKTEGAKEAKIAFETAGGEESSGDETVNVELITTVDPKTIPYGGKAKVTVEVKSKDSEYDVDGHIVRFTTKDGLGDLAGNGVAVVNNGVAEITLYAGEDEGVDTLIATFEDIRSNKTKVDEIAFETKGGPVYQLVIKATHGTSSAELIDRNNPATLTVELQHAGKVVTDFNDVVELTTTVGRLDSEQTPVQLLLENGVGETELHAGFIAGAGRVVATVQLDKNTYNGSLALVSAGDERSDVVEQQPTLTLTLVEASTTNAINAISELSKAVEAEVLIKLELNGADLVLEEQMIRFTTVTGAVLDKETVMLDEDGEAQVSIVPTDLEGAGTLVAVLEDDSSVSATRHFATKGDGHPSGEEPYPVTIELTIEQDGTEVSRVDNTKPATVQIKLVGDTDDIANRLVTVASTVGSVAPTTVLTDSNGEASATLNTKNTWDAGVVTATLQSNEGATLVAESKSFGIKGKMPGEVSIEIELTDNHGDPIGTPQDPITQDTPANIKVTVKQGTDEIAGELVRVSSDLGELSPVSGTTITNDDGEATSLILRAGDEAGAGTLTASIMIDGVEYDGFVYFLTWGANNYDPNEPLVLELDLKGKKTGNYPNSESPITDSNPATVTATLTRGGIAIPEALIHFETDLGVVDPSTGTALTNVDGVATVILQIEDESGAGTITATYDKGDGLVVEKHFEMTQTKDGLQLSELELLDSNDSSGNGLIGKELSATNMAIARVRLVTNVGQPIENEIIYFHVENTHPVDGDNGDLIGIVNPRSALTDSNGYANVELAAGAAGAARLIATYNWKGTELRRSTPFMSLGDEQSPQEPDHIPELGYVADATDPENTFEKRGLELIGFGANDDIPAGSTISIGVNLVDAQNNNAPWPGIVRVQFNSLCAAREDGSASIDSEVALINGRGIATYVAKDPSCEADVIYAQVEVDGKQLEAVSRQFSIDHSEASYIEFVSATPEQIGLKGSGDAGVPETATLTFQVKNADGFTMPAGTKVNFEAVNPLGGFKVDTPSAVTNNNGRVEVKVVSGHMPYSAVVKATLDDDATVFGYGDIKVSTGVVTQDRFRLSLSEFNVAAWNHTEVTVDVTVSAADRMGNHSDGTDVYFTTEVGRIDDFCTIENGSCTVKWYSQGAAVDRFDASRQTRQCLANTVEAIKRGVVKPFDCWNAIDADGIGEAAWPDRFGRNTITAYAAGEESYRDVNGNNIFDKAEYDLTATADEAAWRAANRYFLLASPFRDDNETALYEVGVDEFHDFSDAGISPDYDDNDWVARRFRGVGCSQEARDDGHCEGLTHVRDSVSMVLGTDEVVMTVIKESDLFALTDLDIEHGEVSGEDQPETARFELINGPNVGQYVDELKTSTLDAAGETVYVFVHDLNGNGLANGSIIEADGGGVLTNVSNGCANIANNSTEPEICSITFSPGNPADSIPTIKLVGPNGVTVERTFTIQ